MKRRQALMQTTVMVLASMLMFTAGYSHAQALPDCATPALYAPIGVSADIGMPQTFSWEQKNAQWIWSALGSVALFAVLGWIVYNTNWPVTSSPVPEDTITILGQELLSTFVIPFEIASVLLLAALIGAILIGRERDQDQRSES